MSLRRIRDYNGLMVALVGIVLVSFSFFFFTTSDAIRLWSGLLFFGSVITTAGYSRLGIVSHPRKLEQKLAQIASFTRTHSLEMLQEEYDKIHHLFHKLPAKRKKKYHAQVQQVKERIERKLRAGKRVEALLAQVGKGSIKKQHANYLEMLKIYQKLPTKVQHKYYAKIAHARELLERGKKI